jgi:hypothetical protein
MSELNRLMTIDDKIIHLDQIQPGDVLLSVLTGNLAEKVEEHTGSRYTHASICYSPTDVVHVTLSGIEKLDIQDHVSGTVYTAAIRNPYIWNEQSIMSLQQFLDEMIEEQVGYNKRGALTQPKRLKDHKLVLLAKINEYFLNGVDAPKHKKEKYICSELVAACFLEAGGISKSAAVAFQPDTYSAGGLAKEPYFGFFLGYLTPDDSAEIPHDDEFANELMISDLLEQQDYD